MLKSRKDGLILLVMGAIVFLVIGIAWRHVAPIEMGDFKVVYYSAQCLLQHGDPYNPNDVLRVYRAEGRESATEPPINRQVKTRFFYPPTAFLISLPFAAIGFASGAITWTLLLAGGLILAAIAAWDLASDFSPIAAGVLACLLLANSFWLFMIGNSAAVAVSFCVIAVWCFYRNRFSLVGVLLLALSLALKPNDSGLVWLVLLLAGSNYRKRALQSFFAFLVLSLPVVVWVTQRSVNWLTELRANMASFSGIGGIVDPAATGMGGRNMDSIVQLQSAVSILFVQPATYTLITYAICAPLVAFLVFFVSRNRHRRTALLLALAAAAPLSMLPTYHFQHDAKLILLCIPACAILWARRDVLGWSALLLTGSGIIICGDIFSGVRIMLTRRILIPGPGLGSRLATMVLTRPTPLILLTMVIFYLWVLARCTLLTDDMREEPKVCRRGSSSDSGVVVSFTRQAAEIN